MKQADEMKIPGNTAQSRALPKASSELVSSEAFSVASQASSASKVAQW